MTTMMTPESAARARQLEEARARNVSQLSLLARPLVGATQGLTVLGDLLNRWNAAPMAATAGMATTVPQVMAGRTARQARDSSLAVADAMRRRTHTKGADAVEGAISRGLLAVGNSMPEAYQMENARRDQMGLPRIAPPKPKPAPEYGSTPLGDTVTDPKVMESLLSPLALAGTPLQAPMLRGAGNLAMAAPRTLRGISENVAGDLTRGSRSEITAYHGTPHLFEPTPENPLGAFDHSKMGSGAGSQVYGWGTYVNTSKSEARAYTSSRKSPPGPVYTVDVPDPAVEKMISYDDPVAPGVVSRIAPGFEEHVERPGFPADGSQVYEALTRMLKYREETPAPFRKRLESMVADGTLPKDTLQRLDAQEAPFYREQEAQRVASQYLNAVGIPGMKVGHGGLSDPTYVLFDDKIPRITERTLERPKGGDAPFPPEAYGTVRARDLLDSARQRAAAEAPRPSLAPTDFKPTTRKKYQAAIDAAREKMSPQDRLQVSRIEDDFGGKLYLTPDGKSGFGVAPDGELVALFSAPDATAKGTMDAALKRGVSEGATHLNAYDTYLAKGYGKRGAVETERNPFNPEYAPEGWDIQTMGAPDYVTMKLPTKGVSVKPKKGLLSSNYIASAQRTANPGVYAGPEKVVADLKDKFVEESPLLKELWGVNRDDLYETSLRTGNDEGFIPRAPAKPRGNPEAQRIQTPENSGRILADIEAMKDKAPEAYRAAHAWYVMDPAFRRLAELVGPEEAVKRYNRLNTMTSVESPNLAVPSELTRGTAANMMWEQGRFNEWAQRGGLPAASRGVTGLEGVPGRIGGQSIARKQAALAAKADAGAPLRDLIAMLGHKEGPYAHAAGVPETGFQTSVPAGDAHFVRGTGLADARTVKPGSKVDPEASVSLPELQSLLNWHRQIAKRSGAADAVPAQAIEWLLYAAQTGVKTPVGPGKLEILSQQIAKTAQREGISLQTARDRVLLGKSYAGKVDPALLGLLGMGSAAGAAAYANSD